MQAMRSCGYMAPRASHNCNLTIQPRGTRRKRLAPHRHVIRPMPTAEASLRSQVERAYQLLVRRNYSKLIEFAGDSRLTAADIAFAITTYGRTLQPWPSEQPMPIDAIPIRNSNPPSWSVRIDAFTAEEGRSDLSIEMTITQPDTLEWRVGIDNIHVL